MTVGALVGEGCPAFFPVKVKLLQRLMTQVCRQGEERKMAGWEVIDPIPCGQKGIRKMTRKVEQTRQR